MIDKLSLPRRLRAAAIHLALSAVVAAIASWVVFRLWYPPPFDAIAGGASLFLILVGVDVVLGPALTGVVASPHKLRAELARDLGVIVTLQMAAFGYGIYTMALARPVALSFEVDRMRVVTAADIDPASLSEAPAALRAMPWDGPRLIAAIKPTERDMVLRSIDLGLAGIDLSMVPGNWRDYGSQSDVVWQKARPVALLLMKYPVAEGPVAELAAATGQRVDTLRFLPLVARRASWVTLIAPPDSRVIGHLPFDGFF
jgi:hypothetical protein